jgi:hypothetical protein
VKFLGAAECTFRQQSEAREQEWLWRKEWLKGRKLGDKLLFCLTSTAKEGKKQKKPN